MRSIVALLTLAAMSAACVSTSPPASTAPTAPSSAPTAPSTVGPTTAPTSAGSTDGATFSIPSFMPDTILEAAFPDQIDGQPVTDVTTAAFLAMMQSFDTPQEELDAFVAAMQSIGVNPTTISLGSAQATVGGDEVFFQALRVPGGSAAAVIDQITRLNPDDPRVLTAGTLGGRPVTVATDSGGDVDYYYFNGEYAWLLSMDEAQAAVVLADLP